MGRRVLDAFVRRLFTAALLLSVFIGTSVRNADAANPSYLARWGSAGTGNGQFTSAVSIANGVDPNWQPVLDRDTGRFQIFTPTGTFVAAYTAGLSQPEGITCDASGNTYIADTGNNRVVVLAPNLGAGTNPVTLYAPSSFGVDGSGNEPFSQPCGITYANGQLYVVDRGNHRVRRYSVTIGALGVATATITGSFGQQGNGIGQYESPNDIAVDANGYMWVVDTGNNRIQKRHPMGYTLQAFGGPGSGPGQFNNPRGIAIDAEGILYVADTGNHRVQAFRPDGSFITSWGGAGDGDYQFDEPYDVAVDFSGPLGGKIQVVDRTNHNVKYYDDIRFPSAGNSSIGTRFELLVGNGTVLDPAGVGYAVTVHDEHNQPMPGATVTLDISPCMDLALAAVQPDGALTISCAAGTATKTTDVNGQANFRLAGHVQDRSLGSPADRAIVRANTANESFVLGEARVSAMDQDGVNGLDEQDHYLWLQDFMSSTNPARSDYDGTGGVTPLDLSAFGARLLGGASGVSSPRCDAGETTRPVGDPIGSSLTMTWNDCSVADGGTGSPTSTFTCNTNTGSRNLYATITTGVDVEDVTAYEALVEIRCAPGTTLPAWWDFSVGGCRETSRPAANDGSLSTCAPSFLFTASTQVAVPANGSNREVIRVMGIASGGGQFIPGEIPASLFRLTVSNQRTVGAGSCAGCNEPVEITLLSLRLIRGGECGVPNCIISDLDLVSSGSGGAGSQAGLFYLIKSNPWVAVNTGTTPLHIQGKAIPAGSSVRLLRPGQSPIVGSSVVVAGDGSWIEANFNLVGAAVGRWSIEVTSPAAVVRTLPLALSVETPNSGELRPRISGARQYRVSRVAQFKLGARHYGNQAWQGLSFGALYLNSAVGPVTLSYGGNTLPGVTPVGGPRTLIGIFTLPNLGVSSDALPVLASFSVPNALCDSLYWDLFEVDASNEPLAPARTTLRLVHDRGVAQGMSWPALAPAFEAALEVQMQSELLSRVAALTSSPGANLPLSDHAELVRQSLQAALAALVGTYPSDVAAYRTVWDVLRAGTPWTTFRANVLSTYAGMPSPPVPDSRFPYVLAGLRYCFIQSMDPNDKSGPSGAGPQHAIAAGTALDYLVRFENKPVATAAAQDVFVTDTLDTTVLDPATFEFTEFTFGTHVVTPPAGSASFSGDVDLRPGVDIIVRISGELDPSTGVVRVAFRSLDPATMQPTLDPVLGFLPPNVTSPEGEGSVSFLVQHQAGLADATPIANWARIVFDLNPPIDTPVWSNVIDLNPPASQVAPLAAGQGTTSFPVNWGGTDAGAGVLDYSVWASTDGGPYALWLKNTTLTTANFVGTNGHSYAFYSTSRDAVGLVEAPPATPDATTTLTLGVENESAPLALAIRPIGPSPIVGALRVEFTLPVEGSGALELFDIGGRCVASLSLLGMSPGVHRETVMGAGASPGVYFLRLRQGGAEVRRRVVMTR